MGLRRVGGDALWQTRWRGGRVGCRRVGRDALWLRRVGVDVLVGTRWSRRVVSQTRCGVDALLGTRWRIDALKQTRGRQMSLRRGVNGFLENEQSVFPYQISFPDEPQMQFLSCPWGDLYRGVFFLNPCKKNMF